MGIGWICLAFAIRLLGRLSRSSIRSHYFWLQQQYKLTPCVKPLLVIFADLILVVASCGNGQNNVGRQNSAEWIRAAFHDVATHDKGAGTGGLDASLMYELDRDENLGKAFNRTFADMSSFMNPRASAADLLALSVVTAAAGCGGQKIPFRAGRIDAIMAGPPGVPKPEQSLESHRTTFHRAGFNDSDMIALVACCHTLGRVHGDENQHVTGGEMSDTNVVSFDNTPAAFDTAVVRGYLQNDGVNPLVFNHNDTLNSDKRIFGVDGNITMQAMVDSATFQTTCASVFERMINTVPDSVTLSDPLELVDIKPYIDTLGLSNDGTAIIFKGRIRVRTTNRDPEGFSVAVDISQHYGQRTLIQTSRDRFQGGLSTGFFGESFAWFRFDTQLDPATGISGFNVQLTDFSTGQVEAFDNSGTGGFPVTDGLIYAADRSCLDISPRADGNMTLNVVAMVREDLLLAGGDVYLELTHRVHQQNIMLPRLQTESTPMVMGSAHIRGFVEFTRTIPLAANGWNTVFDIVLVTGDGELRSDFHSSGALTSASCS